VQYKEGWSVELKIITTHNLGDSVRPIVKWVEIPMGPCKELFLQMEPHPVSHLKLVQYPMLIMAFLVLSIGFLENLMDLLVDVLNTLNEYGGFVGLRKNMGIFFLCGCKR
jgi:hypothetical protein